MWLVFDLVTDPFTAGVAGSLSLLFFATLWAGVPLVGHRGEPSNRSHDH